MTQSLSHPAVTRDFPHFSVTVFHGLKNTYLTMKILGGNVNTRSIPATYILLEKYLPNVLVSECFNDKKLPFAQEVARTEIGHLFEHILLENMCQEKLAAGYRDAEFNGVTEWDWYIDQFGTFHIRLDAGREDAIFFHRVLGKSAALVNMILNRKKYTNVSNLL